MYGTRFASSFRFCGTRTFSSFLDGENIGCAKTLPRRTGKALARSHCRVECRCDNRKRTRVRQEGIMVAFRQEGDDELARRYLGKIGSALPRRLGFVLGMVLLLILLFASVAYVPAGNVGVLTLFGRVTGEVLPEGTHLVNPFKGNNTMSVRTQELKETASVPSDEGLVMTLDTSLLFRLNPERAADVYQKIGPGYVEVVVEPNMRSAIRAITASHSANALYTGGREQVAEQIYKELSSQLSSKGIEVQNILLRDIQLPQML